MSRPKKRVPDLVHHKPSGQARVRIEGQDFYLGQFGTPEAEEAYRRIIAEWLATGLLPGAPSAGQQAGASINELILSFYRHDQRYYVDKNGRQPRELLGVANALSYLRRLYGLTAVSEFTPHRRGQQQKHRRCGGLRRLP